MSSTAYAGIADVTTPSGVTIILYLTDPYYRR